MLNCPDCDGPVKYDEDLNKYYCPKCDLYWESPEVEPKESIDHIYRDH